MFCNRRAVRNLVDLASLEGKCGCHRAQGLQHMNMIYSKATAAWNAVFRISTSVCAHCQRSLSLRHFTAQKAGIKMRGCWYCSSKCFTTALMNRFSSLLSVGDVQHNRVSRVHLGMILVSQGLLTKARLREVLDEQKKAGGEIGELLVRSGLVNERQVVAARSAQWGCPVFAVPKRGVVTKMQIPSCFVRLHSAVPLHYTADAKQVLIGFVNDIEYGLLYAIEDMTGCRTRPCFITPGDFQSQVAHQEFILSQSDSMLPREVEFERIHTPIEMAELLCDYAADLEADEVVVGRFAERLWARVKCGTKDVDLLFSGLWCKC